MLIIEITALANGAHHNQTTDGDTPLTFPIPEGWAYVPESISSAQTLESFPFGEVSAEILPYTDEETGESIEVMTVTGWTPGIMPEPQPEPQPELEPEPGTAELTDAEMAAAITEGVNGI